MAIEKSFPVTSKSSKTMQRSWILLNIQILKLIKLRIVGRKKNLLTNIPPGPQSVYIIWQLFDWETQPPGSNEFWILNSPSHRRILVLVLWLEGRDLYWPFLYLYISCILKRHEYNHWMTLERDDGLQLWLVSLARRCWWMTKRWWWCRIKI